jgi:hypothetical protein
MLSFTLLFVKLVFYFTFCSRIDFFFSVASPATTERQNIRVCVQRLGIKNPFGGFPSILQQQKGHKHTPSEKKSI